MSRARLLVVPGFRVRRSVTAVVTALTLTATIAPAVAATAEPERPKAAASAWGKDGEVKPAKVKIGTNEAPRSVREEPPTKEEKAWRKAQQKHDQPEAAERGGGASLMTYVPRGQGDVPWHRVSNVRLTDSLVARVDYSSGNLMLAATDFDIAGVGQNLQLTHTYNSFDIPFSQVSDPWWVGWERELDTWFESSVIYYDRSGATVDFNRNADGSLSTPEGYSLDLVENEDGTFTLTDRKSGKDSHFTSGGTLTKVVDRNGGTISVTQHESGGFTLTEERSGRSIDLTKVSATRWEATDNTGRTVVYTVDPDGNLVGTMDTAGERTTFGYDASGRVTQVITPEGRETVFTYDGENRVTSMQRVAYGTEGPTWTYTYSAENRGYAGTTTVADPDEDKTVYKYNDEGEVTKTTDPLGHERSSSYDAHNVVTAVDAMGTATDPGNTTTYGWDSRNNLTSAKLPTGATTALTGYQTIAGTDLPGSISSPDGEETNFDYDAKGNTLSVATTGDGGGTFEYTYNDSTPHCGGFEGQRCSATDANGKKTSFTYDARGNLTKVEPPVPMGVTTYRYDPLGRPWQVTDGRGTQVIYTYDDRDRVIKVDTASYNTVTYTYDGDGNLTSRTDRTGTTAYTYDALGRETVRTLQDGSQTVLSYNADSANLDSYTDPMGTVDYTFDADNRLTKLTDPEGKVTEYEYDSNDQRTKTTYPGGTVQDVALDDSQRPQRITATSPQGTLVDLSYDYSYTVGGETVGGTKIRSKTDHITGYDYRYTYNAAGRLSYAEETDGSTKLAGWQYCYDDGGNVTSQGITEGCPRGTKYTYNDASQLTSKNGDYAGWSYDKAGNETAGAPTTTNTRTGENYSEYNQLIEITNDGKTYQAEYSGTTNAERIRLGDTTFQHTPLGMSAQTTNGVDTGFIREPAGTLNSMSRGGKSYYYLTDAIGSVVALVNESGTKVNTYDYKPRGSLRAGSDEQVPQPYQFAGAYHDATHLYKMGARYYDSRTGRFTQPDPSGKETNPYLYAKGDFINRIDPNGTSSLNGIFNVAGWSSFFLNGAAGNQTALEGDAMAIIVSAGVTGLCYAGVAATVPLTAGGSLVAGLGCAAVGAAAGAGAQKGYLSVN